MSEQRAEEIAYILVALSIILFNSIEIVLILRIRNKTIFDIVNRLYYPQLAWTSKMAAALASLLQQ